MKILLTGGAGYIGSHTAVALVEAGYAPIVLDNFANSHPVVLERLQRITGRALPLENRLLATLALGGQRAALGLAAMAPDLARSLSDEEVRILAAHFTEPSARAALTAALDQAGSRAVVLRALLALRTSIDAAPLTPALTAAAKAATKRSCKRT